MRQHGFIQLSILGWITVAAGIVIALLSGALWLQTSRLSSEQESHARTKGEYAAFKSEVDRLGKEAKAKADAERARQAQVNQRRNTSYEKRIADLAARYQRLLGDRPGSGGVPAVAETARPTDDAARDQRLLDVLRHADEQTARLIELQQWVKEVTP